MEIKLNKDQSLKEIESIITRELYGKQLWGDINLSQNDYEILRIHIKNSLYPQNAKIEKIARSYPVAITTLLVFLARYKFNTNYWGLLAEELSIRINGPIEADLGYIVRNTFQKYGFDISDVEHERRVNLEPIFYEAGLPPESSLDDLFYILNYDSHSIFDPQLIIEDLVEMRSYQIRKPMLKFLKRFKGDRALEFIMEIHEAMLCVDQNMASDSHFAGNYSEWKARERTKETIASRKKQEFQTKPYLTFDNGSRGLSLVLPRVLLKDEWIEDVSWYITTDIGKIHRKLSIFGDDGKRYIDSITVPVCPSEKYKIELIDDENLEDSNLYSWIIDGVCQDSFLVFNTNGRLITPHYIPDPFGIVIYGNDVSIRDTYNVNLRRLDYPTNRPEYTVQTLESTASDGTMTIHSLSKEIVLNTKPQVGMSFLGKTLFSIDSSDGFYLFTEVPKLDLYVDEGSNTSGLILRIGNEEVPIGHLFETSHVRIDLSRIAGGIFNRFGTYSIRLYQLGHFLKLLEFTLVPDIVSDYIPNVSWNTGIDRINSLTYRFKRTGDAELDFANCRVSIDETEYVVDCPPEIGALPIKINYSADDAAFSAGFELPIRPFELEIIDSKGVQVESQSGRMVRLGLREIQDKTIWISLRFLGLFKKDNYKIILRTVNGIEQEEALSLARSGCTNKDLSVFYDTLNTCPLPARLELCHQGDEENTVPLIHVSDTVKLSHRPWYVPSGFIGISITEEGKNLSVTSFRDQNKIYQLPYSESVVGKSGKTRGYKCPEKLDDGFYIIETNVETAVFELEEEASDWLSNGNDTLYISSRPKSAPIESFSDWLDQLIKDILAAGISNDIVTCLSYKQLNMINKYKGIALTRFDCERLVAIAYFIITKCSNAKRSSMERSMSIISADVLNSKSRLELIRALVNLRCPSEIFDACIQHYHLLLFSVGSEDAVSLSESIDNYSLELSMLLRMGASDLIRNTIWREKYRELIGKQAIKHFLYVPGIEEAKLVIDEQRRFLREQPSKVRIHISPEISGDMEPISTNMIKVTYNKVIFDKSAKPDIGIYFDHSRYVDQYVNWYILNTEPTWDLKSDTRQAISTIVQEYCHKVIKCFNEMKKIKGLKNIAKTYDNALKARYNDDPFANLKAAIPARFFYLQGLAAFLAKLPKDYQEYGLEVRTGEAFMVKALDIAPRIARRDILMASTYLYLAMKEEKLCQ